MAVHHFTAVGIESSRGWQPLDPIPRDGTMVEVCDELGTVVKAQWRDGQVFWSAPMSGQPAQWRYEEG